MTTNKLIYIGATLLCFWSCSGEQAEEPVSGDPSIRFAATLQDIAWSRAAEVTYDNLFSFQATCFNPSYPVVDADGIMQPYFEDIRFGRIASDYFVTVEENCDWPDQKEFVDFMAFTPSRAEMAEIAGISLDDDDSYFRFVNASAADDGRNGYDYSLTKIRITGDIPRQYDFLTANGRGSKFSSINDPVTLPFQHRMAKVELRVWGANPLYRIEIAGVRLGNVPMEGSYNLAPDVTSWSVGSDAPTGRAEYIFGKQADEHSYADAVVVLDKDAGIGSEPENDMSIMGEGGAALLIPAGEIAAWNRTAENRDRGTYFSVLMRVSNLRNGKLMYPYSDSKELMEKIWLAVTDEGQIAERLYRGDDGNFYTDKEFNTLYTGEDAEVREYGWAAVPVDIDWEQGQHYVYTIDYSSGLGVKDPYDTNPGEIILGNPEVNVGVKVSPWIAKDDYEPGIDVPRR